MPPAPPDAAARWLHGLRPHARRWVAQAIAAGAAGALLTIAQAWWLADLLASAVLAPESFASGPALAVLAALLAARALAAAWRQRAGFEAGRAARAVARERTLDALAATPPGARPDAGAASTEVLEHVEALDGYFAHYLPQVALVLLVPTAILLAVLPLSWLAAAILLATVPPIPLFMALVGSRARAASDAQFERQRQLGGRFLDLLRGLPTLKLLGAARAQQQTVAAAADGYRQSTLAVLRLAFLSSAVLELFASLAIAMLALYLGLSLLGRLDLGFWAAGGTDLHAALFILLLAPEFYAPLRALGQHYHARAHALAAATVLAQREAQAQAQAARHGGSRLPRPDRVALRFDEVRVVHADGRVALAGVGLEVAAGARVALVGASGAGKSTLLDLALGLLAPTAGTVRANGADLCTLARGDWHARIAWIGQRPEWFAGSLRENIRIGRPDAGEADVEAAAHAAGVSAFAAALPQGLDTPLGEDGAGLSGGQLQRVAVARALLRDAPLWLLDEPTAHLDEDTERELFAVLARVTHGRTLLLATHRQPPAGLVQRFVRLAAGRVVAVEDAPNGTVAATAGTAAAAAPPPGAGMPSTQSGRADRRCALASAAAADTAMTPNRNDAPHSQHGDALQHGPRRSADAAPARRPPAAYSGDDDPPAPAAHGGAAAEPPRRTAIPLAAIAWRRRRVLALAVLLGAIALGAAVGLLATSGWFLTAAAAAGAAGSAAAFDIFRPGALVRLAALLRTLGRYGERVVGHDATLRLLADLRVWAFGRIEPHALERRTGSGDLLQRLVGDIDALDGVFLRAAAPLAQALPLVLAALALLVWALGTPAALAAGVPLALAVVARPGGAARRAAPAGRQSAAAQAALRSDTVETARGLTTLQVCGAWPAARARLLAAGDRWWQAQRRLNTVEACALATSVVLAGAAAWAGIATAGEAVSAREVPGVWLAAATLAVLGLAEALAPLASGFVFAGQQQVAYERLAALGAAPPAGRFVGQGATAPARADIRLAGVGFAYPDRPPVLLDANFDLPQGTHLAVVGANGAGKSTLLALLARAADPGAGRVLLGGLALAAYDEATLRRQVVLVPQQPHVFDATVAENLRLAAPAARDGELLHALAVVQLADWLHAQPAGLATRTGSGGTQLSGGQARRLALARALLQSPTVLLLDEPTEGLDDATAAQLIAALRAECRGRTLVVVTHRAPVARAMESVLRL
ncbi:MAG: thiol reductant ABC exporter subunit CydD [Betaproteobacteria bacterium]